MPCTVASATGVAGFGSNGITQSTARRTTAGLGAGADGVVLPGEGNSLPPMRILVTGHTGYIGSVLTDLLIEEGMEVHGCDPGFFKDRVIGPAPTEIPNLADDVRDLTPDALTGFDALIHLAALSNDPLGDLDPQLTLSINTDATVELAKVARDAGVGRFLFSSSCSLYGGGGDTLLDESAPMNPVTVYGESKVQAERRLGEIDEGDMAIVSLRNATAYGFSPRLRSDIVVNELVGMAITTGSVVLKSDGSPWRPLVHVRDISRAFIACLTAPVEQIDGEAFNVVPEGENYQVAEMAQAVVSAIPGTKLEIGSGAGPDVRNYQVDGSKITSSLGFEYAFSMKDGIEEMAALFEGYGLTEDDLGRRFRRLARLNELSAENLVDNELRWLP